MGVTQVGRGELASIIQYDLIGPDCTNRIAGPNSTVADFKNAIQRIIHQVVIPFRRLFLPVCVKRLLKSVPCRGRGDHAIGIKEQIAPAFGNEPVAAALFLLDWLRKMRDIRGSRCRPIASVKPWLPPRFCQSEIIFSEVAQRGITA